MKKRLAVLRRWGEERTRSEYLKGKWCSSGALKTFEAREMVGYTIF